MARLFRLMNLNVLFSSLTFAGFKFDMSAASPATISTCLRHIDYIGSPRNGTKETADTQRALKRESIYREYRGKREPTTTICVRTSN